MNPSKFPNDPFAPMFSADMEDAVKLCIETLKSRDGAPTGPKFITVDFGKAERDIVSAMIGKMPPLLFLDHVHLMKPSRLGFPPFSPDFCFHGTETGRFSSPSKEAAALLADLSVEMASRYREGLKAIREEKARKAKLAAYESDCGLYEDAQRDYAEANAATFLPSTTLTDTMDVRLDAAIEMAKTLYRKMNAAPVHPFPPREKTPEEHDEELRLEGIRGVDAATQMALHLKRLGAATGKLSVVVDGEEYSVHVFKEEPKQLTPASENLAPADKA
jgi:hypothetical protein